MDFSELLKRYDDENIFVGRFFVEEVFLLFIFGDCWTICLK